jgi:hypothetical protein
MTVDGAPAALIARERFSYGQTAEISLEYEMQRVRTSGKQFLLLFEREGESLEGRKFVNGGIIGGAGADSAAREHPRAIHTARIRVADKNGNEAVVLVPFRIADGSRVPDGGAAGRNAGGTHPDLFSIGDELRLGGSYSFQGWIGPESGPESDGMDEQPPDGLRERRTVSLEDVAGRPFRLGTEDPAGMSYVYCMPLRAGEAGTLDVPDLGVSLHSRPGSFFSGAFVFLSPSEPRPAAEARADQRLEPRSKTVFFGPWSVAPRSRLDLAFLLDRTPTGAEGVYRWNAGSGRWSYNPSRSRGDTVASAIGEPGVYGVFADETGPAIAPPVLTRHTMYGTRAVYPEIVFGIDDAGSGIDDSRTELRLDGDRVIGRYDPIRKKMFVLLRRENIIGDHTLEIVARDRVGNESRLHATLAFSASTNPDSFDGVK